MMTGWLNGLALGWLVASIGACAPAGAPRYHRAGPPELQRVGRRLNPADVVLFNDPIGALTLLGSGRNFRLALAPTTAAPPRAGKEVGAVRSADQRISPPTYDRLECGWRALGLGEPDLACRGRQKPDARAATAPIIEHALADLRRQAAAAGVTTLRQVRCFAATRHLAGRLWCEAIAWQPSP